MNFKQIKKWFESEEGKQHLEEFAKKLLRQNKIRVNQLDRFSRYKHFVEFTEKVIEKYNSKDIAFIKDKCRKA